LQTVSNHLKEWYIQNRFRSPDDGTEDIWQLLYPEHFANVLLIKQHKRRGEKEIFKIASMMKDGLMKFFGRSSSYVQEQEKLSQPQDDELYYKKNETLKISDIFNPIHCDSGAVVNPKMILVNGAPGMGKTTLCKEIAYRWGKGLLLNCNSLVFLLFLRDPAVQRISTLKDLVHYFYNFDQSAADLSEQCAHMLIKRNGSDVTIILDGYDEFTDIDKNFLTSNIVNHKILSQCTVMITSRPIASEILQKHVDITVEVFGFTDDSKKSFIEQELQDHPNESKRLVSFLNENRILNSACYIPILLTLLVCTFKDCKELPNDEIELYERFISLIISRFIQKLGSPISNTALCFKDLPKMHQSYLANFSKFAFEAIKYQKHIFTNKDIEKICYTFAPTFNSFHGLGLLNSIQYRNYKLSKCISYNFVHLSIQEYLAAYYLNSLDVFDLFKSLKQTFLVNNFIHTWTLLIQMKKDIPEFCTTSTGSA